MPLVKCEYCNTRVRPNQMDLHLKHCINYRRLQKAGKVDKTKATRPSKPLTINAQSILAEHFGKKKKAEIVKILVTELKMTKKEAGKSFTDYSKQQKNQ